MLEELVRRQEGLSAGVKEVLAAGRQSGRPGRSAPSAGWWPTCSTSASRSRRWSRSPWARRRSTSSPRRARELLELSADRVQPARRPRGLRLARRPQPAGSPDAEVDLEGRPGVLGRADRFVETQPRFAAAGPAAAGPHLVRREARPRHASLARTVGRGLSFVTLAGELLEPDGTLVVGPRHAASRPDLAAQPVAGPADATRPSWKPPSTQPQAGGRQAWTSKSPPSSNRSNSATAEHRQAVDALAENRVAITAAEERRIAVRPAAGGAGDRTAGRRRRSTTPPSARLADAQQKRQRARRRPGRDGVAAWRGSASRSTGSKASALAASRETTEIKVELAKSEERLRNLHARLRQFEESRQERHRAIAEAREHLAECTERAEASRWNILRAESEIAELYLRKETFAAQTVALINQREALQQQRTDAGRRGPEDPRPRSASSKRRSTPPIWPPTRSATNAAAWPTGSARTTASSWPSWSTSPAARSSTSARRCSRRSTSCGRRSTTSAT